MNGIMETSLDDFGVLVVPRPKGEPEYDTRAVMEYRKEHGLSANDMTPELLKQFAFKSKS